MSTEKSPKHRVYTAEEQQVITGEGERLKYQISLQFEKIFHEKYRNFDQAAEKIQNKLNQGKNKDDDDYFSVSGATLSQYARGFTRIPERKLVPICDALEIPTQNIRENDVYYFDEGHSQALLLKFLLQKYNVDYRIPARKKNIPESFVSDLLAMKHFNVNELYLDNFLETVQQYSAEIAAVYDDLDVLIANDEWTTFLTKEMYKDVSFLRTVCDDLQENTVANEVFLMGNRIGQLVAMLDSQESSVTEKIPDMFSALVEKLLGLLKEKGVSLDDATKVKLIKMLAE